MDGSNIYEAKNLAKSYQIASQDLTILKGLDLTVKMSVKAGLSYD